MEEEIVLDIPIKKHYTYLIGVFNNMTEQESYPMIRAFLVAYGISRSVSDEEIHNILLDLASKQTVKEI